MENSQRLYLERQGETITARYERIEDGKLVESLSASNIVELAIKLGSRSRPTYLNDVQDRPFVENKEFSYEFLSTPQIEDIENIANLVDKTSWASKDRRHFV